MKKFSYSNRITFRYIPDVIEAETAEEAYRKAHEKLTAIVMDMSKKYPDLCMVSCEHNEAYELPPDYDEKQIIKDFLYEKQIIKDFLPE